MTDGGVLALAKVYGATYRATYDAYNEPEKARKDAAEAVRDFLALLGDIEKEEG